MSTKKRIWRRVIVGTVAGILGSLSGAARADVVTDESSAILVYPKIRVDTAGQYGARTDTIVQITNTSRFLTRVRCFYVNANQHCSNAGQPIPNTALTVPLVCQSLTDCNPNGIRGGVCSAPVWLEHDFQLTLTKRQPLSWRASEGLTNPCPPSFTHEQCSAGGYVPLTGGRNGRNGQNNADSRVPKVDEDPFIGELKCIEVTDDDNENPLDRNDLKGEATIVRTEPDTGLQGGPRGGVDASKYNAVGIQAVPGCQDSDPTTVSLGGPLSDCGTGPEYNACPNVYVLDHFFDSLDIANNVGVESHRKADGTAGVTGRVATDLVVVPCSEDLLTQNPAYGAATLQFLIYNEFEQRFSTATRVNCFKEVQLANIDTRETAADNVTSIFSVAVQGTLTGQTRIRSVPGADRDRKVLIIAEEVWEGGSLGRATAARNVQNFQPLSTDAPTLGDKITLP